MPSLTFEDGGLVYRDGALGLGEGCCCDGESCDLSSADDTTQAAVSLTTDCNCEAGTLDGSYSYIGLTFNGYAWSGNSTCDTTAFGEFLAPVSITVGSDCSVNVSTYGLGDDGFPTGLDGTADGTGLVSVDGSGNIVGTVSVDLENFNGVQCTATVVFGP